MAPPANVSAGAVPAEMKEICLPVPAETSADFSVKELNDSMQVSLLEEQEVARFHMKRHKLLSDELHTQDCYIFDVPSDGSCQFAGIRLGLVELVENPPADDQEVRDTIVDYLLMNRELFEDGSV